MENQTLSQVLPINEVHPSVTNPRKRFNEEALQELAKSIAENGVIQPILVRPLPGQLVPGYEIVAGERRWRASKIAAVETIPAVIRELNDLETLQLQITENLQRSDLHPLEEAFGFKALLDNKDAASWDADQLAAKVGKSRSYIYASLKLTELCVYAQDAFYDGKLKRETAILIARIPGEKLQTLATQEITKPDWQGNIMSYRATLAHLQQRFTLKLSSAPFKITDASLLPAAGSCKTCPSRSGNSPEIFPDIESADVCTNPDCFKDKQAAHIAQLKSAGDNVIEGAEAKKIMPHTWDLNSDYVKLEDNCPGKAESIEKVLGKDTTNVLTIVDPDKGGLVKVIKKSDATEALKAKGIDITFGSSRNYTAEEKEKERLAKIETTYRLNVLSTVIEKIKPQLEKDYRLEDYEQTIIARAMLRRLDHETGKRLLKLRGIHYTTDDGPYRAIEGLNDAISVMSSAGRMMLLMQMALIAECYVNQYSTSQADNLHEVAKNNGLDIKSIREATEAEFAPKSKSAKNSKTVSTPPIAAQAKEIDAGKKPEETSGESMPAEEKKLPPKLQKIKDAELAKRERRAKSQGQKVSANADVPMVPADKATGTVTEVANA